MIPNLRLASDLAQPLFQWWATAQPAVKPLQNQVLSESIERKARVELNLRLKNMWSFFFKHPKVQADEVRKMTVLFHMETETSSFP